MCTSRDYNVQKREYVNDTYVKMCCDTSKFLVLQCCGTNYKPQRVRGLIEPPHCLL